MDFGNVSWMQRSEDGTSGFVGLPTALAAHRVLFLDRPVTTESVSPLVAAMLLMELDDPEAPITLYVNSPGGEVQAGMALIDAMRDLSCPVQTVVSGLAASMAAHIACCGDKRSIYPNAKVLIHQVSGGAQGQESDIAIAAEQAKDTRSRLDAMMAEAIGKTPEEVHELTERDRWFTAEAALEIGLVDEVLFPTAKKGFAEEQTSGGGCDERA